MAIWLQYRHGRWRGGAAGWAMADDAHTLDLGALIAHGLLNSLAIASGAAATLSQRWHELPEAQMEQLLEMVTTHIEHAVEGLWSIAKGLPPDVATMLAEIDEESRARHPDLRPQVIAPAGDHASGNGR